MEQGYDTGERPPASGDPAETTRKEIYTYKAPWTCYALSWSVRSDQPFRLAVGSYLEEYANQVELVHLNDKTEKMERITTFDHPYPATKIMWMPSISPVHKDLLATTGDYLRLWDVKGDKVNLKTCLNNVCKPNRKTDFCAPLTSFDWNQEDPKLIGVSSIDTTCSIWDIEAGQTTTQLIAHDKEVFDIAFAQGTDIFASVGADGSVRLFDLRALDHSTIVYEYPDLQPILKLTWNKQDPNYIATIGANGTAITILDIRVPTVPISTLNNHRQPANSIQWAPHSSCHICSGSDDNHALIWDLNALPKPVEDPILAYEANGEINNLHWSQLQTDWISIAFDKTLQILRV